ncbi:Protein rarD [Liberibacter crescens BT-1]|uniref:Protein rarD n=1 Tax=Liberibacter crescens (strain BT-1) TaxID=1215343 RepID=L0ETL5_LIBCB|nr:EamA family transporter RarD [Liberibacter crescens]AGA64302.1 Protein rarD [Liberibacter crescens BT-1]AMC12517.1 permease [Liberibacter crescens]
MKTSSLKLSYYSTDNFLGLTYGLSAYTCWGFLPLYIKLMDHLPLLEVLSHRILWSLPILFIVIVFTQSINELKASLKNLHTLAITFLTSIIIACNWGLYMWGITSGNTLDTVLGYFINPLFSIAFGAILLKEKLTRLQIVAVILTCIAVTIIIVNMGRLPWLALSIAISWSLYGLLRKAIPINPNQGLFIEILILSFPAALIASWFYRTGQSHFLYKGEYDTMLLIGFGFITGTLLSLFANATKYLKLSTLGMVQYVSPTISFLIAVLVFKEKVTRIDMITFIIIWTAIIIYITSNFLEKKNLEKNKI